jgi:type VI secretion system protein ImpF
MAQNGRALNIWPSLLVRLLDQPMGNGQKLGPSGAYGVKDLRDSVKRDLEAMFNTRREANDELPEEYRELRRSLLMYGLPDCTSFNLLSDTEQKRLQRSLEETIASFEPRLAHVQVQLEPLREHDRTLRFRVNARLRIDPVPEPVAFSTVLLLHTQAYEVQG